MLGKKELERLASRPGTLEELLSKQGRITTSIKWQYKAESSKPTTPPTDSSKVAWPNWKTQRKQDLIKAFQDVCGWLAHGAPKVQMNHNGLTDQPVNTHPDVSNDATTALQFVSPDYMWQLYIAHVAFSLAAEFAQLFPWSIIRYTEEQLRYLFDSTTMAWNIDGQHYLMGTYAVHVPDLRAHNLPKTAFAPPQWTYHFLQGAGLIGENRRDTICQVLEWMRQNLTHFTGEASFGNCFAIWQYRGYPPLSKIIGGTVDSNQPELGVRHYTAGCHGSVGFLNAVLRVANIPVQPVWVCGHELACFMTEGLYLDHGDDPYNQNVKNSSQPIINVLIREADYKSRFSSDLKVNITDDQSPACANVGLAAIQFPQS